MSPPVLAFILDPHRGFRLEVRSDRTQEGEASGGGTATRSAVLQSRVLAPYAFGGFTWDPIEALAETVVRMDSELSGLDGDRRARSALDAVPLALWCRVELDLARFARDPLVRGACDAAAGTEELARFADLNGLWRALHRAVAPAGLVPGRWRRWLDGRPYEAPRRAGSARRSTALFVRVDRAFRADREGEAPEVARVRFSTDTASRQSPT